MIITVSSAIDKLVMVYHLLALELFPDVLLVLLDMQTICLSL